MKYNLNQPLLKLSSLALAFAFAGCSDKEATNETTTSTTSENASSAEAFVLKDAPTSPMSVKQARDESTPGQSITVIGQVGGTSNPIVMDYASFIIADQSVHFCDETPDDMCETPWDACCEDPDTLAASRASVVFLDDQGQPLPVNLAKTLNLSGLDLVSIVGVVAPTSTPKNLIIHANGLYRHQAE